MKFLSLLAIGLLIFSACSKQGNTITVESTQTAAYQNTELDVEDRVDDLVARMTLSEKISQMYNDAPAIERLNVAKYDWWNESLHGVARAGKATVFPQAIGLAATFDKELMEQVATAISDEARAKYHYFIDHDVHVKYAGLTFWSPNINIFRDPRWGRGQETYGEDPYLTSELAVAYIKAMQGDDPKYLKTAAMAKHYAVHSGPEKSRHSDNYSVSPKDLRETYLPAFKAAVEKANVESIMCAYNRVNDLPACGNDPLLKDILRGEWGFKGHVVSDCGALADFYGPNDHAVVLAPAAAAAWALKSGTDLNCGTGRLSTFANLGFALQLNMVSMDDIDTAVKRLFTTRFKLGMFDPDEMVSYSQIPTEVIGSKVHLQLAEKSAEQSLVLLKNDGILPLAPKTKVAVIGPNAINPSILVGNYHGEPINPVTPLDGIKAQAGATNTTFSPGSPLIADQFGHYTQIPSNHLFHRGDDGQLRPGLKADYYRADINKALTSGFHIDQVAARVGEPVISRVDNNIDFYWQRSPVDDAVFGNFGVVWQGVLIPKTSGHYLFKSSAEVTIDGELVTGALDLVAEKTYDLEVHRTFLRLPWGNPIEPQVQLRWVNTSTDLTADALLAAKSADVIIFTGGISAELEGEEMDVELEGFDHGDRTDLRLPKEQRDLLEALHALGKPIVLVNFSGSAMALNWENKNLNAIVQAFYPGEGTGTALAKILWGETNPSGRLPITFYQSVKQLPGFKDYSYDNRTYRYFEGDVLYPFGYGLSFTSFQYSQLNVPQTLASNEALHVSVQISNTGSREGTDIAQLYISMENAPVKTPVRELKAFQRVSLAANKGQQLNFTLSPEQLRYVDNDGNFIPYKGKLKLTIGSGQEGYVSPTQMAKATIDIQ